MRGLQAECGSEGLTAFVGTRDVGTGGGVGFVVPHLDRGVRG